MLEYADRDSGDPAEPKGGFHDGVPEPVGPRLLSKPWHKGESVNRREGIRGGRAATRRRRAGFRRALSSIT